MRFERRNIRLPWASYRGRGLYFVTFCCEGRSPIFADGEKALWLIDCLRQEANAHRFAVRAFCVMPDHLHVLAEGLEATSDLLRFVKVFKQKTAHSFKRNRREHLWQKKFYDHILRPHELPDHVAWYIWLNPVRAGLCAKPQDYPYLGSFTMEWRSASPPTEPWVPGWKKNVPT